MLLSWLARRRAYQAPVAAEATRLVDVEGGAGYNTARRAARLARERGDVSTDKLWGRVAQVADRTSLVPGHSKIGRPESEW
jgi:hypothetical protein